MPKVSAFRSGAFRFALMVAAVFAVGTIAVLFLVERTVSNYATEVARDSVTTEVSVLREEDRASGRARTIESIAQRENAVREHQLRYLLVGSDRRYLAGSLPATSAKVGWYFMTLSNRDAENDDGASTMTLMAFGGTLPDGATLVVASDTSDLDELRWGLGTTTGTFGIVITLLALLGGLVVGSLFLRRLDRVNRSVERIMQGSMSERFPAIGMSIEFDQLCSNLNRMLDRIEALLNSVRQVSTDIAHDLRTPLTRLRQRLEDLREQGSGTPVETEAEAALVQVDQLLGVFRALLRLGALEAGVGRNRIETIDLSDLMERCYQVYLPAAEDSGHQLSAMIEPGVSSPADRELLTQAVTNLIENAMFHTPAGTTIVLSLATSTDGIAITVADHGPGVPAAERENVVKRFYRLDPSRGGGGAGLGLSLVGAIAENHRAKLTLTDNQPGLRIELLLPATKRSDLPDDLPRASL
jgi:signal transduction histidine kinase